MKKIDILMKVLYNLERKKVGDLSPSQGFIPLNSLRKGDSIMKKLLASVAVLALFAPLFFLVGCGGGGGDTPAGPSGPVNGGPPVVEFLGYKEWAENPITKVVDLNAGVVSWRVSAPDNDPPRKTWVCYGTVPYPDNENGATCITDKVVGTGDFKMTINGVANDGTAIYYVRVCSSNGGGTGCAPHDAGQITLKTH